RTAARRHRRPARQFRIRKAGRLTTTIRDVGEGMRRRIAAVAALLLLAAPASAADNVKIGFVTTLSGPAGIIGKHMKDASELSLSMLGGKVGGLPAQIGYGDDQQKPEIGRQVADEMRKRDKVDVMTGCIWSYVMLAL